MAEDKRPPLPSLNSNPSLASFNDDIHPGDPFADRPRVLNFQEPQPRPYESTASLPQEFGGLGSGYDEDEQEKVPLTSATGFSGGLYPPGCVTMPSHNETNALTDLVDLWILTHSAIHTRAPFLQSLLRRQASNRHGGGGRRSSAE